MYLCGDDAAEPDLSGRKPNFNVLGGSQVSGLVENMPLQVVFEENVQVRGIMPANRHQTAVCGQWPAVYLETDSGRDSETP